MSASRPLVAVSLKNYLGARATRDWVAAVEGLLSGQGDVEVALLPSFPLLESTAATLTGSGIAWGAQDVAPSPDGAQTGEVGADLLAELGCTYVEVGHAERRRLFGETDEVVAAKTREAVRAGLVPLACVGEESSEGRSEAAARACVTQLEPVLDAAGGADLVVAYEPVWAIGSPEPAPAEHVRLVCGALADRLNGCPGRSRVIYGGAAGPGTWASLAGDVDGLFLGRFAHDPQRLADVVAEVATTTHSDDHPQES